MVFSNKHNRYQHDNAELRHLISRTPWRKFCSIGRNIIDRSLKISDARASYLREKFCREHWQDEAAWDMWKNESTSFQMALHARIKQQTSCRSSVIRVTVNQVHGASRTLKYFQGHSMEIVVERLPTYFVQWSTIRNRMCNSPNWHCCTNRDKTLTTPVYWLLGHVHFTDPYRQEKLKLSTPFPSQLLSQVAI